MSHQRIVSLSLTLTTLLITLLSASADQQLIITTCKNIAKLEPVLGGNYQICIDFLKSDPRSVNETLEGLGEISFELTKKKAVAIESQIKSLLADPKVGSNAKKVLKDCAEMYDNADDSISDALNALKKGDFSGANIFTSAAMDAPSDCEDGFEGGGTSPLKKVNDEIEKLYSISLVFTNLLHK
ncbi:uncharacterized protein [Phyllobates terribilis]|uniref:uncharacterized protein n=1 Tax=Phyllobates terribilis TaxID=111132 RepID=UPI003CCADBB3